MYGYARRLGPALLALPTLLLLGSTAWAQGSGGFCELVETGRLSVQVSEIGSGVVVTLSTVSAIEIVHEQAEVLAERARAGLAEGTAPPPGRGEWPIIVPASAVILHERVSGAVLIFTDLDPDRVDVLKSWGARVMRLLEEGRCDDLLTPLGEV